MGTIQRFPSGYSLDPRHDEGCEDLTAVLLRGRLHLINAHKQPSHPPVRHKSENVEWTEGECKIYARQPGNLEGPSIAFQDARTIRWGPNSTTASPLTTSIYARHDHIRCPALLNGPATHFPSSLSKQIRFSFASHMITGPLLFFGPGTVSRPH